MSFECRAPNFPTTKNRSIVAIFERRTRECCLRPLLGDGYSSMSVASLHLNWVLIKQTVMSLAALIKMTAGLNLFPVKSVKGNGINTMSPLVMVFLFQVGNGIYFLLFMQERKAVAVFRQFLNVIG